MRCFVPPITSKIFKKKLNTSLILQVDKTTANPHLLQSLWKLLDFYQTMDEVRLHFADIKHDYTQHVYQFHMCFAGCCPQTGKFCGDCYSCRRKRLPKHLYNEPVFTKEPTHYTAYPCSQYHYITVTAPHYWPCVRRIHKSHVDSLTKGQ